MQPAGPSKSPGKCGRIALGDILPHLYPRDRPLAVSKQWVQSQSSRFERHGHAVAGDGRNHRHGIPDANLGALGVPGARIRALQGFAEAIATGSIALDRAAGLDDAVPALCALPGIGPWTAHYIAMRACAERDAFPGSDLAIRRELGADPEAEAERWRPWRAYGAMHIWTAHAG